MTVKRKTSEAEPADAVLHQIKAKTARGKRILDKREPQVVERVKTALFVKGTKTSTFLNEALSDLFSLKKPDGVFLGKRNELHPFEGGKSESVIEFLSQRNDASLLLFGSHSKKRPNSLCLIRMFDYHILDMVELSITDFLSIKQIQGETCRLGAKPSFIFIGEVFEQKAELKKLQNMLVDFFRGQIVESMEVEGLESVIAVSADDSNRVHFRVYRIQLKKSDNPQVPRLELSLMGPSIDMQVGRTRLASDELVRQATKVPKELKPKKIKNISHTSLGDKMGRVHVGQQDLSKIQVRKMKGLKKQAAAEPAAGE